MLCDNHDGTLLSQGCHRWQAESKVEIIYSQSCFGKDADIMSLCLQCTRAIKRDAESYGYKVIVDKL